MDRQEKILSPKDAIHSQRQKIASKDVLSQKREALRRKKERKKTVLSLTMTGLVVYLIFGVVLGIALVEGESMVPAIQEKDLVLFWRLERKYQSGDVVLIEKEGRKDYIKRIVGVPGDEVDINQESGEIRINGSALQEPYIIEPTYKKGEKKYPLVLKEKEYFVLGDHRADSLDSRNYGAVDENRIEGKVIAVLRGGSLPEH